MKFYKMLVKRQQIFGVKNALEIPKLMNCYLPRIMFPLMIFAEISYNQALCIKTMEIRGIPSRRLRQY